MGCSDVLHGRCSPTRQHNHLQVYTGATNTLLIIILVIQQYIATYKQVDSFAFVPALKFFLIFFLIYTVYLVPEEEEEEEPYLL